MSWKDKIMADFPFFASLNFFYILWIVYNKLT